MCVVNSMHVWLDGWALPGMDGRVIVWNLPSLNIALASLGLQ